MTGLAEEMAERLRREGVLGLKLRVIPKSSRTELAGYMDDGTLKVRVAAAPEKGKANAELRAFLARILGVGQRQVTIVSGESSQNKQVRVSL
ncbi:MAG: DUF167 domain-containing protein [Bryobacteraceae bacterium]